MGLRITRRAGDSFTIGEDIRVNVKRIGCQDDVYEVELYIDAPRQLKIWRHDKANPDIDAGVRPCEHKP